MPCRWFRGASLVDQIPGPQCISIADSRQLLAARTAALIHPLEPSNVSWDESSFKTVGEEVVFESVAASHNLASASLPLGDEGTFQSNVDQVGRGSVYVHLFANKRMAAAHVLVSSLSKLRRRDGRAA